MLRGPPGRNLVRQPAEPIVAFPRQQSASDLTTSPPLGLLGISTWGLLDQSFISAMNFGTMLFLAKGLGPAEFGAFSLAYLALLLSNSLQTALVTQPHNVLAAYLDEAEYADYSTSALAGQLALAAAFTTLIVTAAAVGPALGWNRTDLLVALAVAVPAWQLQEFARRVFYTKGRVAAAFANDAISYGGQLVLVVWLSSEHRLTGPLALYVIAGTSAIAALAGFWSIRAHLHGRIGLPAIRESWRISKWLSAATVANWFASQMYPVLTAGVLGVYMTGVFRALQNLLVPTQVLANAFQMVFTPRASLIHAGGGRASVAKLLTHWAVLLLIPMLLYLACVGLYAKPIITFFYSPLYAAEVGVMWLLGLAYLLSHTARILTIGLTATQNTRPIFHAQLAGVATTFTVGLLLVHKYGLVGSALGAAVTQAVQVILLAAFWRLGPRTS
jgi:O-antigen/teichoic acid export membrane protein